MNVQESGPGHLDVLIGAEDALMLPMRTTRNQNRDNAKQTAPEEPPFRVKAASMGLRAGLDPAKLSQIEVELDVAEQLKPQKFKPTE